MSAPDLPNDFAFQLHALVNTLYGLSLGPTQKQQAVFGAMAHPGIGSLVIELSGFKVPQDRRVGWLLADRREAVPGDWGDEAAPLERVWYIETLDGKSVRWTNATFVAAPGMLRDRDWLAAALARHSLVTQ